MAKTDEDKQLATHARASKLWRTLRVASKSKLNLLDKIDDGNNLQALFEPEETENRSKKEESGTTEGSKESPGPEAAQLETAEPAVEAARAHDTVVT